MRSFSDSLPFALAEQNPEHLLIFSAGNNGGFKDTDREVSCTIGSPALGKNSLAVGSTSSGPAGGTITGADGRRIYDMLGLTNFTEEGYPWICVFP